MTGEAIFAVLPLFLTSMLGASTVVLGAIEGVADTKDEVRATASTVS